MKSVYTYLLIALALVGCKKNYDIDPSDQLSSSVRFNTTLDGRPVSKAVTDVNFDTYGIFIAGYHTIDSMSEAIAADPRKVFPNLFNRDQGGAPTAVPLVKKNGAGQYALNTVKFGTANNSYLSYYSWAQQKIQDTESGVIGATKSASELGYPWLDIRNSNDIATQVDIVASRSSDNPNAYVTSSVDLDFEHILSKLTFMVLNSTTSDISFSKIELSYGASKAYRRAQYTFNSDPASSIGTYSNYSEFHSGSKSLSAVTVQPGKQSLLSELLLVPQKVDYGFMVFKIDYSIKNGSATVNQSQLVSIPATDLQMGVNHIFTIDVTAEDLFVRASAVDSWNTIYDALPLVAGTKETLLLLEGSDQPYRHIDGTDYWLDRSGYNRHVRLSGGFVSWNKVEQCYNFSSSSSTFGGDIPSVGKLTAVSISVLTELTSAESHVPIQFFQTTTSTAGVTPIMANTASNSRLELLIGSGGTSNLKATLPYPASSIAGRAMWTFQYGANQFLIYDNVTNKLTQPYTSQYVFPNVIPGRLASGVFRGKIFYVRVENRVTPLSAINEYFSRVARKYRIPSIYLDNAVQAGIPLGGGSYTVQVTSSASWTATSTTNGVTMAPKSGPAGVTNVVITVPANPSVSTTRDIPVVFASNIAGRTQDFTWTGSQLTAPLSISLDNSVQANIPVAGGRYTVRVTCNGAWDAACAISGVTMTPTSGAAGTMIPVIITVPANPNLDELPILVRFNGRRTNEETVSQDWTGNQLAPPPSISLDNLTQNSIPPEGGSYTVQVTSNAAWFARCNVSGVTISSTSGTAGTIEVTIRVPAYAVHTRDIPVVFTANRNGETKAVTWTGRQGPPPVPPEGSYIPRVVIAATSYDGRTWPANRLPTRGLQVAVRGNRLPGNSPLEMDNGSIWSTESTTFSPFDMYLGSGLEAYRRLRSFSPTQYPINLACRNLGSEWYVPSLDELRMIADNHSTQITHPDYTFIRSAIYWTSSGHSSDPTQSWYVQFTSPIGYGRNSKESTRVVRCVREI